MKALRFLLLCIGTLLLSHGLPAQEPSITIRLDSESFLFGQPVWATYTITNTSQVPIYLSAQAGQGSEVTLLLWNAQAFRNNGVVVPIHKDYGKYVGEGNRLPKRILQSGEHLSYSQPVPVTDVTIDELPSGRYRLVFSLNYSAKDTPGIWEKEAQASAFFEIAVPVGEDAAWLKDLHSAILAADNKDLRRSDRQRPLGWYEILEGPVEGIISRMLQVHPTSSYAGYVLSRKVPDWSNPLTRPMQPWEQVCKARDEGKTLVSFPDNNFEGYFKQLDTFMKGGHVPEALRAELYGFYGDLLVQRGRFPEAGSAFKEATKDEPSSPRGKAYFQRSKDFLAALEKKSATAAPSAKP